MFIPFLYELREHRVPVGLQEARMLARALELGLHDSSLDGFYHVARALLVHSEAHLDAFDKAFLHHFRGVGDAALELSAELLSWLEEARRPGRVLTPEEAALLEQLDADELKRLFEQRLKEQRERHDGGNRWIGTGGASPFGNQGAAGRPGVRAGGQGGNRSAISRADVGQYERYRDDLVLDTRQIGVALRKLRAFSREGGLSELDVDETINATARNAGELEVVVRPPRRPNTRVILMMDVGGSMTPYAYLVSRLFSAASKATHFKELRTYYFHNCIYGRLWTTHRMEGAVEVDSVLKDCGPQYKLILVGDALMAPYELMSAWGSSFNANARSGLDWLIALADHFPRHAWLNPEPEATWHGNTIETVARTLSMFPLTLDGLSRAVAHLIRGGVVRGRVGVR